jgi:hypothetical protein
VPDIRATLPLLVIFIEHPAGVETDAGGLRSCA